MAFATPIRETLPWTDQRAAPRGRALLVRAMVEGHNRTRADYGSPPLSWDAGLAKDALTYANWLARHNRFQHDPQGGRRPKQGENLWMGTRTAYSYEEMVGGWIGEKRWFKPGRFPDNSRKGDWSQVGHYTQMIWPTTRAMGCATASNRWNDYLVCRYSPAGNMVGVTLR